MTKDEAHEIVAAGMRGEVSEERFREAVEFLGEDLILVHAFVAPESFAISKIFGDENK